MVSHDRDDRPLPPWQGPFMYFAITVVVAALAVGAVLGRGDWEGVPIVVKVAVVPLSLALVAVLVWCAVAWVRRRLL